MKGKNNIAFIDGQNLNFGITKCVECAKKQGKNLESFLFEDCTCGFAWKIDYKKFRQYLKDKYSIVEAYYYLGYVNEDYNFLYKKLQRAGYIVEFRAHSSNMKSKKKGNVDTEIVFEMMKKLIDESDSFDQVVLVSGDGDYKNVVDYFLDKKRFLKVLFPNNRASSLYKKLGSEYYDYLENNKVHIQYISEVK